MMCVVWCADGSSQDNGAVGRTHTTQVRAIPRYAHGRAIPWRLTKSKGRGVDVPQYVYVCGACAVMRQATIFMPWAWRYVTHIQSQRLLGTRCGAYTGITYF